MNDHPLFSGLSDEPSADFPPPSPPLSNPPPSEHRFAPEEITEEIRLSMVEDIGPKRTRTLLDYFGNAAAVFEASADQLGQVEGISPKLARVLSNAKKLLDPWEVIDLCAKNKIQILVPADLRYPSRLREIGDAPPVLYVRGTLEPEDALAVAMVGTRGMSLYGRQQATRLAGELARAGFTVVSGLAAGIDGAAHQGALDAGGRTLAVLGGGVLKIYPTHHDKLAEQVMKQGAILSEFHPLMAPLPGNFPQRNRIVSGLSLGVLVIESPRKGGSLITARLAMEQNREVFAVPGPVDREGSRGCHQLIRDGAKLVETVDDIIEEFGPLPLPIPLGRSVKPEKGESPDSVLRHPGERTLNPRERSVLDRVGTEPTSIDDIIAESGLTASQVIAVLSVLEMKRLVRRVEGNKVRRN